MDILSLTKVIDRALSLNLAIVLQRNNEIPIVNLKNALESWQRQNKDLVEGGSFTMGFNRPGNIVSIIPKNTTGIEYYETAMVRMGSDNKALVVYETMNQTSSFSYLQKSLTNLNSFTHEGDHNSYDDLRLNVKTLFELNPLFTATGFIEHSLGVNVSSFLMCEYKSLPAFQELLKKEGFLADFENKNLAPDVKAIGKSRKQELEESAEALLKTAAQMQHKKAKRHKGSVTMPELKGYPHCERDLGEDFLKDYMTNDELKDVLRNGFARVGWSNIENKSAMSSLLHTLSSTSTTAIHFEKLLSILFGKEYQEVPMISRLNFIRIICSGMSFHNLPRRKGFIWHNYRLDFESVFGSLGAVKNNQSGFSAMELDNGEEYSARRIKYCRRTIGEDKHQLIVSYRNSSMNFEFTEVIRFKVEQEKDAKFFIERMFTILQDSLGTVPAIYTILNSTWFEGH